MTRRRRIPAWLLILAACLGGEILQAQRLADPPALGPVSGTIVDPVSGQLTVGVPVGVVPGEIPVAVSYRINGAPMTQRVSTYGAHAACHGARPDVNPLA